MDEKQLTKQLNSSLKRCASGFNSIHETRLEILALIEKAGYKSPEEVTKLLIEIEEKARTFGWQAGLARK